MARNKQTTALPSASALTLWATWLWRLALAVVAGYGSWLMLNDVRTWTDFVNNILYFTLLSTVAVFLVNLGSVIRPFIVKGSNRHRLEGNHGWFRGATTSMTILTGIVYAALLGAQYPNLEGIISHIACPILMILDWIFVGQNQTRLRWFVPVTWAATFAPYLWLYSWNARYFGRPMYDFLDPNAADWWLAVALTIATYLALCYLVLFLAKVLRRLGR
ncbi:MAG: hypothetical protein QM705_08065 [Ancrocorticia sp.]